MFVFPAHYWLCGSDSYLCFMFSTPITAVCTHPTHPHLVLCLIGAVSLCSANNSIYPVHDDAKDKENELGMSRIGDEGRHLVGPSDLKEEAELRAKEAIEQFED